MIKYISSALLWYIRWICFKEAQADACASGGNKMDYGDELGPTIEWLRKDKIINGKEIKGKTWDDIIESASRPGSRFNRIKLLEKFPNEHDKLIPILDKYKIY